MKVSPTALLVLALAIALFALEAPGQEQSRRWAEIESTARGQTVYFNTWGGEPRINRYLVWVAEQVSARHDITLRHVRLADTALATSRILAEKQTGNSNAGSVDLVWVNGENFATLKSNDLLFGSWAESLPNFSLVNADRYPEMRQDFTVPTAGLESPWLRAQLVFYYDTAVVLRPPMSIRELLVWAADNPGEFTYPRPPDFLGSTFLKQALLELNRQHPALYEPVNPDTLTELSAPLWSYLDQLHPYLLHQGRFFPSSGSRLRRLLADGDTALAFSFSPGEAVTAIAAQELPKSVRAYVLAGGTISNVSFLAIPFNATSTAAAQVVANFLLSPQAQARASQPQHMGSATVLDMDLLNDAQRRAFANLQTSPSAVPAADLNRRIPEPHPSWMPALEQLWLQRYMQP